MDITYAESQLWINIFVEQYTGILVSCVPALVGLWRHKLSTSPLVSRIKSLIRFRQASRAAVPSPGTQKSWGPTSGGGDSSRSTNGELWLPARSRVLGWDEMNPKQQGVQMYHQFSADTEKAIPVQEGVILKSTTVNVHTEIAGCADMPPLPNIPEGSHGNTPRTDGRRSSGRTVGQGGGESSASASEGFEDWLAFDAESSKVRKSYQ